MAGSIVIGNKVCGIQKGMTGGGSMILCR
jgi:hypothetical protein